MTSDADADRATLDDVERALVEAARVVRARAYAPYSRFLVGAALRAADGTVVTGVNVENAAYPVTLCAERAALGAAVAAGHRRFTHVAIAGSGPDPCTPCGMCRQALVEFGPGITVVAAGDTAVARFALADGLLPAAFGPTALPS